MAKKGHSEPNIFGGYTNYDENGHRTGHSDPNLFGGYTHYDEKGKKVGHSEPNPFGGYTDYDKNGHRTGHSDFNVFGGYTHYDENGHETGHSDRGMFHSYNSYDSKNSHKTSSSGNKSSGSSQGGACYVATCVYGSYDCPQVWTLRRFRDGTLSRTVLGRAFIRTYYAVSPHIVKRFGEAKWFQRIGRGILDRLVRRLNLRGVEDTPYQD